MNNAGNHRHNIPGGGQHRHNIPNQGNHGHEIPNQASHAHGVNTGGSPLTVVPLVVLVDMDTTLVMLEHTVHNVAVTSTGESGTNKNLPPYMGLFYIIRIK